MNVAFHVTGHGFGHATRAIAVMQALHRILPHIHFIICTEAPAKLFADNLPPEAFTYRMIRLDVGAFEKMMLDTDVELTVRKADAFYDGAHGLAKQEAQFLLDHRVRAVLFDVPPLAPEIAFRAGVPSVGVANFTWDFIYRAWKPNWFLLKQMAEWQAKTTLALQLPIGHELEAFPRRERIPLIARKSTLTRAQVRRELGIGDDKFCILLAMRGMKAHLASMSHQQRDVVIISFGEVDSSEGIHVVEDRWNARFVDVLEACDVVLTKPGYGIISECYAARKPMLHLPRKNFAETPLLMQWMDEWLSHAPIMIQDIREGRLIALARELAARPYVWKDQPINGAQVAAQRVAALIG